MKLTLNKLAIGVLLLLVAFIYYQQFTIENQKTELATKSNLLDVLQDSVRYTQDELNREVATKRAILSTVKDLEEQVGVLTLNQKKLLTEVKKASKKDHLKAGVQVEESVIIDSIEYLNSKTVLIKETKKGTEVSVVNSNPNFRTLDLDVLVIPHQKKKLKDSKFAKVLIFVAGISLGIILK